MSIAFSCPECDKPFKVADEMAGRKGKCNNCGATMLIPELPSRVGISAKRSSAPFKKSAPTPDRDDDDFDNDEPRSRGGNKSRYAEPEDDFRDEGLDEDDNRPKKRKKKKKSSGSNKALWISAAVAGSLVLMVGGYFGIAALVGIWPFGGPGEAMKYMPDNCKVIISIRWDEMESSQAFKEIKQQVPELDLEKQMNNGADKDSWKRLKEKGITDVVIGLSYTGAFGSGPEPDVVGVVKIRKSMTQSEFLGTIDVDKYKEEKVGSYKTFTKDNIAGCLVNSRMMIFGKAATVKKVLERDKKPEFSAGLKAAMDKVSFSKSLVIVADLKGAIPKINPGPGVNPAMADPFGLQEAADEVEGFAGEASVGSDVTMNLTLLCKSSNGAENVKKKIEGLLALGKMMGNLPKESKEMIDSFKVTVSGNSLTSKISWKGDAIAKAIKSSISKPGGPPVGGGFGPVPGAPGGPGGLRPPPGGSGKRPPKP